jgi:starch phosphorylase
MTSIQIVNVAPCIPKPLRFLETLVRNVWWSWNQDAISLLRRMDPSLWRTVVGHPLEFLRRIPQPTLQSLAVDETFLKQLAAVEARFNAGIAKSNGAEHGQVAYFSLEFGLHETIRLYSGGLGVLAGDHLKAASDLGIPLVAVGLFYHQGYFEQCLTYDGWQQEQYTDAEIPDLPMKLARNKDGEKVEISIPLPEGRLHARVWDLRVGGIPLILLDANIAQNPPELRDVTARLYGGGQRLRLQQELLLAVGGMRALLALGMEPEVCHMNEGHAAFLSLGRMDHLMKSRGLDLEAACEVVAHSNVFTTHTPVPAGNETFPVPLVEEHLRLLEGETGVPMHRVLEWGRAPGDKTSELSMTILGLRMAHQSNGVSRLHGDVARGMWNHVWPGKVRDEVPIGHVTNGVHAPTWLAPEMLTLLQTHLGGDWEQAIENPDKLKRINDIPDEELWRVHELARARLFRMTRNFYEQQLQRLNANQADLAMARSVLDPNALTIGFARRAASYKRATLILRNPERLEAILNDSKRPVQIIFAGKAHPADEYGKDFIKQLVHFSRRTGAKKRVLFLENYNIAMARTLVQGVDVWLNTPRRRVEASGTSGMKAALNGVLNWSILDGWWCEGYAKENGWAIGNGEEYEEDTYADEVEAAAIYRLLEDEIAPTFYDRVEGAEPTRWIQMMKACLRMSLGFFTTRRMVGEYRDYFYKPASENYRRLLQDDASGARSLVSQRQRLDAQWGNVVVRPPAADRDLATLYAGDSTTVRTTVCLGHLRPDEVRVELCHGPADSQNLIRQHQFVPMTVGTDHGSGWFDYTAELPMPESGRFGLTARAIPAGNSWQVSSPGYVTWATPANP